MIFNVTGFTHSKGISKTKQKPYNMGRLYRLADIRVWENENGRCRAAGFQTDDQTSFEVFVQDDRLVNDLLLVKYPCELDLQFEPNPDDPTRNVVTGFKVAKQDKNPLG